MNTAETCLCTTFLRRDGHPVTPPVEWAAGDVEWAFGDVEWAPGVTVTRRGANFAIGTTAPLAPSTDL
ncbi:hypothetical protein GCM10009722_13670 [Williamsia deligens]